MAYEFNIQEGESINYFVNSAEHILGRHKGKKGLLVDFGAHVGVLDVMAVREEGFEFAIAVEPNLENFVRLVDNIQLNDCQGYILPVWAAVSNQSYKTGVLYSNNQGVNSGIQSLNYKDYYPSENVCLVTMNNLLASTSWIDLLKIDIEGGEWDLFTPDNEHLFQKARWLDIELHHMELDKEIALDLYTGIDNSRKTAEEYLAGCGFKLTWNDETAGLYGPRKHGSNQN
jgi:FkbM family methyltransferase